MQQTFRTCLKPTDWILPFQRQRTTVFAHDTASPSRTKPRKALNNNGGRTQFRHFDGNEDFLCGGVVS